METLFGTKTFDLHISAVVS